ncbi:Dyp-type peroxidase [Sphaerotilus mobilis]|uniref:Putative iron-dependent peroxidase n=1 Tax=Sphaerotilus mobilis TaxID=47994 RepID=A0A4Q7LVZ9_9BURK|nr:Dyp-type peroxidase [Sphaerotilus mobilis]RZS58178.1 putative iron-dependent peroxidase [Sphaerotilus mobilis]
MYQTGIFEPIPAHGRYLGLARQPSADRADVRALLQALAAEVDGRQIVLGLGAGLVTHLAGADAVPGLHDFHAPADSRVALPETRFDLWLWLRGEDPAALLWQADALRERLAPAFVVVEDLAAFRHGDGRDLTGYEDGTENPVGEAALAAAFVDHQGPGLDGASLLALQRWQHDLSAFRAMTPARRDLAIGRRLVDNEEIEDAPATAHVKRTAQEDFDPEAFVLRRSMPWLDGAAGGLYFTAFARSLDAFEAQLARMSGAEDGEVDALFTFSHPLTGATLWCPPMHDGRIDLRALSPDRPPR